MRRRDLLTLLGGTAAMWPFAAWAQQSVTVLRIGILMAYAENDPEAQALIKSLEQALQELGWKDRDNLHIEYRWAAGDRGKIGLFAKELVALHPDLILANTTPVAVALQHETKTIPIVFSSRKTCRCNCQRNLSSSSI